jgi:hypothetical protein
MSDVITIQQAHTLLESAAIRIVYRSTETREQVIEVSDFVVTVQRRKDYKAEFRRKQAMVKLVVALEDILDRYVATVLSGDGGSWDIEQDKEVIKARAVLKKVKG